MLINHLRTAYPDFNETPPNISDLTGFYKEVDILKSPLAAQRAREKFCGKKQILWHIPLEISLDCKFTVERKAHIFSVRRDSFICDVTHS